ncbi:MAG: DMP19 family protein [Brevundimonas sp.]|uniref:DMP19 family protein n=1 Tax=Brevundimonas sp. TaxID=1871086 RepID=UPI004034ED38
MSYWDLVAPYWDEVRTDDTAETFSSRLALMPTVSQHLFTTHWTQSEVQNGGLGQFFGNSTGILAPEAVTGFRELGMLETSAELARAMRVYGEPYPRDWSARESITLPLEIEDRFSELLETEVGGFWEAADRFAMKNS